METTPSSLEWDTAQLPVEVARIVEPKGDRRTLTIYRGTSPDLVSQLIDKSKQPHIAHELNCPKDSSTRFADESSYNRWVQKGRTPYFMTGNNGDLAGIIWYGPEGMPHVTTGLDESMEANHTFAIRLYEGYSGNGSGLAFIHETIRDYIEQLNDAQQLDTFNGIHLQTNIANKGAEHLYRKAGWVEVDRDTDNPDPVKQRITMVMPIDTVFEICSSGRS